MTNTRGCLANLATAESFDNGDAPLACFEDFPDPDRINKGRQGFNSATNYTYKSLPRNFHSVKAVPTEKVLYQHEFSSEVSLDSGSGDCLFRGVDHRIIVCCSVPIDKITMETTTRFEEDESSVSSTTVFNANHEQTEHSTASNIDRDLKLLTPSAKQTTSENTETTTPSSQKKKKRKKKSKKVEREMIEEEIIFIRIGADGNEEIVRETVIKEPNKLLEDLKHEHPDVAELQSAQIENELQPRDSTNDFEISAKTIYATKKTGYAKTSLEDLPESASKITPGSVHPQKCETLPRYNRHVRFRSNTESKHSPMHIPQAAFPFIDEEGISVELDSPIRRARSMTAVEKEARKKTFGTIEEEVVLLLMNTQPEVDLCIPVSTPFRKNGVAFPQSLHLDIPDAEKSLLSISSRSNASPFSDSFTSASESRSGTLERKKKKKKRRVTKQVEVTEEEIIVIRIDSQGNEVEVKEKVRKVSSRIPWRDTKRFRKQTLVPSFEAVPDEQQLPLSENEHQPSKDEAATMMPSKCKLDDSSKNCISKSLEKIVGYPSELNSPVFFSESEVFELERDRKLSQIVNEAAITEKLRKTSHKIPWRTYQRNRKKTLVPSTQKLIEFQSALVRQNQYTGPDLPVGNEFASNSVDALKEPEPGFNSELTLEIQSEPDILPNYPQMSRCEIDLYAKPELNVISPDKKDEVGFSENPYLDVPEAEKSLLSVSAASNGSIYSDSLTSDSRSGTIERKKKKRKRRVTKQVEMTEEEIIVIRIDSQGNEVEVKEKVRNVSSKKSLTDTKSLRKELFVHLPDALPDKQPSFISDIEQTLSKNQMTKMFSRSSTDDVAKRYISKSLDKIDGYPSELCKSVFFSESDLTVKDKDRKRSQIAKESEVAGKLEKEHHRFHCRDQQWARKLSSIYSTQNTLGYQPSSISTSQIKSLNSPFGDDNLEIPVDCSREPEVELSSKYAKAASHHIDETFDPFLSPTDLSLVSGEVDINPTFSDYQMMQTSNESNRSSDPRVMNTIMISNPEKSVSLTSSPYLNTESVSLQMGNFIPINASALDSNTEYLDRQITESALTSRIQKFNETSMNPVEVEYYQSDHFSRSYSKSNILKCKKSALQRPIESKELSSTSYQSEKKFVKTCKVETQMSNSDTDVKCVSSLNPTVHYFFHNTADIEKIPQLSNPIFSAITSNRNLFKPFEDSHAISSINFHISVCGVVFAPSNCDTVRKMKSFLNMNKKMKTSLEVSTSEQNLMQAENAETKNSLEEIVPKYGKLSSSFKIST